MTDICSGGGLGAAGCRVLPTRSLFSGSAGSRAEKLGALTSPGGLRAGGVPSLAGTARGGEGGPAWEEPGLQNCSSHNELFFP